MKQSTSGKNDGAKIVWISWERQRRSLSLSKLIGARTYLINHSGPRLLRHIRATLSTLGILTKDKPRILFVQNPSRILTLIACLLKPVGGYFLIVDRHSNFFYKTRLSPKTPAEVDISPNLFECGLVSWILGIIDRYTLKVADLTIVTNQTLANAITHIGGKPLVLEDPFPIDIPPREPLRQNRNDNNTTVFFVCSWAEDEPIDFVVQTFAKLSDSNSLVISGRPRQSILDRLGDLPNNVRLAGFLSDSDYFQQMADSDIVLVLTTRPATLVCGAYEAIAYRKPLILSNSYEIRGYFADSAIYTDHDSDSLIRAIQNIRENSSEIVARVDRFFDNMSAEWDIKFDRLAEIYQKHL